MFELTNCSRSWMSEKDAR